MTFTISPATSDDIPTLLTIAAQMGDAARPGYFQRAFAEGRDVFIARDDTAAVGCVMLVWQAAYPLFRRFNIPEIQDLCVIPAARGRGIGDALVARCEDVARARGCTDIGLGVGLYTRYGAAQRLYVRRGFMPDGAGIAYDEQTVPPHTQQRVDDFLTLKMLKRL
jgi:GNAT superfamily N-acetyltransferase